MERIFMRPDGQTISNQSEIDRFLEQRRSIEDQRKVTSPHEVVKKLDLSRAVLARRERILVGKVDGPNWAGNRVIEPLYEIPDLTIDLASESGHEARETTGFILSAGGQKITIDVRFAPSADEYFKHYGNEKKTEKIVEANLMAALHETNWRHNPLYGWSGAT